MPETRSRQAKASSLSWARQVSCWLATGLLLLLLPAPCCSFCSNSCSFCAASWTCVTLQATNQRKKGHRGLSKTREEQVAAPTKQSPTQAVQQTSCMHFMHTHSQPSVSMYMQCSQQQPCRICSVMKQVVGCWARACCTRSLYSAASSSLLACRAWPSALAWLARPFQR